jgi:PIN domain nuclease of toxin-antitoxin system
LKLLLDTHGWLWLLSDPERLRKDVLNMLLEDKNEIYLSVASVWEMVIKHSLGKLTLPRPPAQYIPERVAALGHQVLSIEQRHVLRAAELPSHHKDPFDRILVAQAQVDSLSIVTADPLVMAYEVDVIRTGA